MIAFTPMMRVQTGGALLVLLAALPADAVRAQQVGTAAAVNPAAQVRGSGGARTIVIGQSIAHRERIQTTSVGSVQLLFLDKTSMTIGPNSDLAIDEYVYDPASNTGKLAATLTKGVMRFVGGQISHAGNAQVTTPTAVVGIRGGVGIFTTRSVFIGYGEGSVRSGSSSVTLGAGDYTQTQGGGVPPTNPGPPPANFLQTVLAALQSQAGQGGGARATSGQVNQARATATGASGGTIATASAVANVASAARNLSNAAAGSTATTLNQAISTSTQTAIASNVADQVDHDTPDHTPDGTPPRQFGATAFAFNIGNCCTTSGPTSNAPYLPDSFATGNNRFVSPVMGYRLPSTGTANNAPYFQWGVDLTGEGPTQSSWFFVMTGALVQDNSGSFALSSGFGATRRGSGGISMGRANGAVSSMPGSMVLDGDRLPVSATVNQDDFVASTQQYRSIQAAFFPGGPTPFANYGFTQQLSRISTPSALGSNRPAETLHGWTGGLMRTINFPAGGGNGTFVTPAYATLGIAQVALDPHRNRMQADFHVASVSAGSSDALQTGHFQMGSLDPSLRPRGAYVDYDNFGAREAVVASHDGSQFTQISTVNGQSLKSSTTFMVNVPRNVAHQIDQDTVYCQCDYTRWGFWSTDSRRAGANGSTNADWGHMMTWVAGRLPQAAEVPSTGTATYAGHVVASIRNVSTTTTEYLASGNMSNTINFATRTGTASVANLDGTNYAGSIQLNQADPRFLIGALTGNNGGRNLVMAGNLFRGATSPVGEMGGNVYIEGNVGYRGSGIFAARMQP